MVRQKKFNAIYLYDLPQPFQDNLYADLELCHGTFVKVTPNRLAMVSGYEQVREQLESQLDVALDILIEVPW